MSFSYIPDASFSEELLLHSSGYVWWGASLTLVVIILMRSFSYTLTPDLVRVFSYTPDANFSEEFLLHSSGYVWWGVLSIVLVKSFVLHWSGHVWWGVSLTLLMLVFSEEFPLHSSGYVWWVVSLTLLMLVLVRSFSYTLDASFSEEFLLDSWC